MEGAAVALGRQQLRDVKLSGAKAAKQGESLGVLRAHVLDALTVSPISLVEIHIWTLGDGGDGADAARAYGRAGRLLQVAPWQIERLDGLSANGSRVRVRHGA
eukprot:642195-Pleurochrysis_carterae.AAC.1